MRKFIILLSILICLGGLVSLTLSGEQSENKELNVYISEKTIDGNRSIIIYTRAKEGTTSLRRLKELHQRLHSIPFEKVKESAILWDKYATKDNLPLFKLEDMHFFMVDPNADKLNIEKKIWITPITPQEKIRVLKALQ